MCYCLQCSYLVTIFLSGSSYSQTVNQIQLLAYIPNSLDQVFDQVHPVKFIPVQTSCDEYKYSSWPRTINDWNSLPPNIINMTSISNFKAAVNNYISA